MFAEVKKMLQNRISGDSYDAQIILWIEAAIQDLTMEQIVLDGICDISREQNQGVWEITDNSTIEDKYVFAACAAVAAAIAIIAKNAFFIRRYLSTFQRLYPQNVTLTLPFSYVGARTSSPGRTN